MDSSEILRTLYREFKGETYPIRLDPGVGVEGVSYLRDMEDAGLHDAMISLYAKGVWDSSREDWSLCLDIIAFCSDEEEVCIFEIIADPGGRFRWRVPTAIDYRIGEAIYKILKRFYELVEKR